MADRALVSYVPVSRLAPARRGATLDRSSSDDSGDVHGNRDAAPANPTPGASATGPRPAQARPEPRRHGSASEGVGPQPAQPLRFQQIAHATDLHRPPDNWLTAPPPSAAPAPERASSLRARKQDSTAQLFDPAVDCLGQPASVNIAHSCINDWQQDQGVDVVASASTMKTLLTAPFSKQRASFAVHRVGQSVLIDHLDMDKKRQDSQELQRFQDHVRMQLSDGEVGGPLPPLRESRKRDRRACSESTLLSKFLYRSIYSPEAADDVPAGGQPTPPLHPQRQHIWSFRDVRALISSDMAIFGDERHPAVSLRLAEQDQPVHVLTGMDYWLDNLMCQVPEVVMCLLVDPCTPSFHLKGIVQQYEVVKTEDLPAQFDFEPEAVVDIAQNVLSFLRAKCTQQGHTYWLYKGEDEDVVRLYDLTVLCEESDSDPDPAINPFSHPVALLLFRIALRMLNSDAEGQRDTDLIRTLLGNALKLLDGAKHPELPAYVRYLLAGLQHPGDDDPVTTPPPKDATRGARKAFGGESPPPPPPPLLKGKAVPLPANMREHTQMSLEYIGDGVSSLLGQESSKELVVAMLRRAASLYCQLGALCLAEAAVGRALHCVELGLLCLGWDHRSEDTPGQPNTATNTTITTTPATATGITSPATSTTSVAAGGGGAAPPGPAAAGRSCSNETRTVALSMNLGGLDVHLSDDIGLAPHLEVCADALFAVGTQPLDRAAQLQGLHGHSPVDSVLAAAALRVYQGVAVSPADWLRQRAARAEQQPLFCHPPGVDVEAAAATGTTWQGLGLGTDLPDAVSAISLAIRLYERVVAVHPDHALAPANAKLGNALNVLGTHYMEAAARIDTAEGPTAVATEKELWQTSYSLLLRGVQAFRTMQDGTNLCILHCNLAKLMRVGYRALLLQGRADGRPSRQEHELHDKCIEFYELALGSLGRQSSHPPLWDSVNHDLASASLGFAQLLHDGQQGDAGHIVSLLQRATQLLEAELRTLNATAVPQRWADVRTKVGRCHSLLGASYARDPEYPLKHLGKVADRHYERALQLFSRAHCSADAAQPVQALAVRLSWTAGCTAETGAGRLKQAYQCVLDAAPDVAALESGPSGTGEAGEAGEKEAPADERELLASLEARLHALLRLLLRKMTGSGKTKAATGYKQGYTQALQHSAAPQPGGLAGLLARLKADSKRG